MRKTNKNKSQAIKLIDRLMKISPDQGALLRAMQIRERFMLPMADVLNRIPGKTITQKAAACGVSRQAFYAWQRGVSRPNTKQAERLSELTGYDTEDIKGRTKLSPRQGSAAVAAAAAKRASRPSRLSRRI